MRFVRSSLHYHLSATLRPQIQPYDRRSVICVKQRSNILSKKAPPDPQTTRSVTNSLPQTTNNNCRDTQTQASICMLAWNCRRLANVIPYLQTLADSVKSQISSSLLNTGSDLMNSPSSTLLRLVSVALDVSTPGYMRDHPSLKDVGEWVSFGKAHYP